MSDIILGDFSRVENVKLIKIKCAIRGIYFI